MAQSVGASETGLRCMERHRFELRPLPDTFYLFAYLFCPIVLHAGHGPMEAGRIKMKRLLTFYIQKSLFSYLHVQYVYLQVTEDVNQLSSKVNCGFRSNRLWT